MYMPAGNDFNNQQMKERAQYLNMRGAQIAEQKAGENANAKPHPKQKGSSKQLIGTIIGIVAFFAVLILLAVFEVI